MVDRSQPREETDGSVTSIASGIVRNASLSQRLESYLNTEEQASFDLLNRSLSIRSIVSAASSYAKLAREAALNPDPQPFFEIGKGSCGVVFEQIGLGHVAKRAISNDFTELWNDHLTHVAVNQTFASYRHLGYSLCVPSCMGWRGCDTLDDKAWWEANQKTFPEQYQDPRHLLFSERVLPLPESIRHALIDLYCPHNVKESALESPGNKHCLVRLYLGRRRATTARKRFFTLKNFQLHLDQMEALSLNTVAFAKEMAFALSIMHWKVQIDARDVEFVLGSEPNPTVNISAAPVEQVRQLTPGTTTLPPGTGYRFQNRIIHLWLLDFNQCRNIQPDQDGLSQAVDAFIVNDPYYPRPSTNAPDQKLWEAFRDEYLRVTKDTAPDENCYQLALQFIELVEEHKFARQCL